MATSSGGRALPRESKPRFTVVVQPNQLPCSSPALTPHMHLHALLANEQSHQDAIVSPPSVLCASM